MVEYKVKNSEIKVEPIAFISNQGIVYSKESVEEISQTEEKEAPKEDIKCFDKELFEKLYISILNGILSGGFTNPSIRADELTIMAWENTKKAYDKLKRYETLL